jgi:hypothetical protein
METLGLFVIRLGPCQEDHIMVIRRRRTHIQSS